MTNLLACFISGYLHMISYSNVFLSVVSGTKFNYVTPTGISAILYLQCFVLFFCFCHTLITFCISDKLDGTKSGDTTTTTKIVTM